MSSADGASSNSSSSGSSPSTTLHQGTNGGRSPTANNKPRPGRPPKKVATLCGWCEEPSSGKQPMHKYVWEHEKKEFCSKSCIAQFKEAHSRGFCVQCDNVLGLAAPHKEFCSMYCLNKYQRANAAAAAASGDSGGAGGETGAASPNGALPSGGQPQSTSPNNNNHHVNNNNSSASAPSARSFQYESFHVFNWDDYLKVSVHF